jgi:hypothetical protein
VATIWPIVPASDDDDDDDGGSGGMISRENRSILKENVLAPPRPPKIPHDVNRAPEEVA